MPHATTNVTVTAKAMPAIAHHGHLLGGSTRRLVRSERVIPGAVEVHTPVPVDLEEDDAVHELVGLLHLDHSSLIIDAGRTRRERRT